MINIFLCVNDFDLLKDMMEIEKSEKNIKIVGISTAIVSKPEYLLDVHTDIMVLQYGIHQQRAAHIMKVLSQDDQYSGMEFITLFDELSSDVVSMLLESAPRNFMVHPYSAKMIVENALKMSEKKQHKESASLNDENLASYLMMEIGLPPHLNGFAYIRSASILISQTHPSERIVMREIYDRVAHIHKTTAIRVEKCVRTAIHFAYRNHPELICIHNTRPTGAQVIVHISEQLKLLKTS